MASFRWFTGFEDGVGSDCTQISTPPVGDGTARTGDFYFSSYIPTGVSTGRVQRTLGFTPNCPSNGTTVICRMQFAIRARMYPVQSNIFVGGFSTGSTVLPNQDCRTYLSPTGRPGVLTFASSGSIGPSNYMAMSLELNKWYVYRIHYVYSRGASTSPSVTTLEVFDAATIDVEGATPLETLSSTADITSGSWQMTGTPTLATNGASQILDFDDWWMAATDGADAVLTNPVLAWPSGSRVQAVPVTGQGDAAQWTGTYLNVLDVPHSATVNTDQAASAIGQQTTFTHDTAAVLGLIPEGQLPTAPVEAQDTAPPFTGGPIDVDNFTTFGFATNEDPTVPTPTLEIATTAGEGSFTGGVWVRAFTIKYFWSSSSIYGEPTQYSISPMTDPVWISANDYPNFASILTVTMNPSTDPDTLATHPPSGPAVVRFTRFGVGVFVTNAYSTANGILSPRQATAQVIAGDSTPSITNLRTQGGPTVNVQTNGFGSLVAYYAKTLRTDVPYPITNPQNRPTTYTFTLQSPTPVPSAGSQAYSQGWTPLFLYPEQQAPSSPLPISSGIKVYASIRRASGSGTDSILINGVTYAITTDTTLDGPSANHYAIDWTERTAEEFDALVFGAQAGAANSLLANCLAEVMTAGPCTRRTPGTGQYQQRCGIYTSNGAFQTIQTGFTDATGAPVAPSAVFVKRIGTTASPGVFKAWWMGGTQNWLQTSITQDSIGIMALVPEGFTVGPSNAANGAAATYAYVAIRDGQEDTVNDAYMTTGYFQRQGSTDPDLTVELGVPEIFAPSWIPNVILIFGDGLTVYKTPDMAANQAFTTTGSLATNLIPSVASGAFTTGVGASVSNTGRYAYMAFRFDPEGLLATVFDYGTYVGTGANLLLPTNFQGEFIMADRVSASAQWRSYTGNSGLNAVPWIGGAVTTTGIVAIAPDSFTVGTALSSLGVAGYWLAWKIDGVFGNTGGTDLPPPGPPPDEPSDPLPGEPLCPTPVTPSA